MANENTLLGYEDFKKKQNNFYLHFVDEEGKKEVGDLYREKRAYRDVLAVHPERFGALAKQLGDVYREKGSAVFRDEHYMRSLYRAYCSMYPYAETNQELFR